MRTGRGRETHLSGCPVGDGIITSVGPRDGGGGHGLAVRVTHHEAVGIARHGLGLLLLRAGARHLATERLHRRLERRQARPSLCGVCLLEGPTSRRLLVFLGNRYFRPSLMMAKDSYVEKEEEEDE